MQAAFSGDAALQDMAGTSCCLNVVNPTVGFAASDGTTKDVYGGCIEPAFPPRADYLTLAPSQEPSEGLDVVTVVVSATGDISTR